MKTANIYKAHKVGDVVRLQGELWEVVRIIGSLDCLLGGKGIREVDLIPSNALRSTSEVEYAKERG